MSAGIDESRIGTVGYGPDKPIEDNDDEGRPGEEPAHRVPPALARREGRDRRCPRTSTRPRSRKAKARARATKAKGDADGAKPPSKPERRSPHEGRPTEGRQGQGQGQEGLEGRPEDVADAEEVARRSALLRERREHRAAARVGALVLGRASVGGRGIATALAVGAGDQPIDRLVAASPSRARSKCGQWTTTGEQHRAAHRAIRPPWPSADVGLDRRGVVDARDLEAEQRAELVLEAGVVGEREEVLGRDLAPQLARRAPARPGRISRSSMRMRPPASSVGVRPGREVVAEEARDLLGRPLVRALLLHDLVERR